MASKGGQILGLYKLAAKFRFAFFSLWYSECQQLEQKQYQRTGWEEFLREENLSVTLLISSEVKILWLWLALFSLLISVASLTSEPGVPLSLSKPALYTKRTPCVGGKREGERESRGSLQPEFHFNVTHPNSPPPFSALFVAVPCLYTELKTPNISVLLSWKKATVGQASGRRTPGKPSQSVFGWTFHSVAHLGPHKCWNSLNMWELWVFSLWLSRGLNPWNKKTNTMGNPTWTVSIESSLVHVTRMPSFDSVRVIRVG